MNKALKKYMELPIIGRLVQFIVKFLVSREGSKIAHHFTEYLSPVVASDSTTIDKVYKIRHEVYCEELKFEPPRESKKELDEFDKYSNYCLMLHKPSGHFAGTVRVVSPEADDQMLPIEKYCGFALESSSLKPSDYPRDEVCEISRLAVPAEFRRRNIDKYRGAEHGVINEDTYSEAELRCFPFLAIGLYLAAASLAIQTRHKHAFVMMEPRLAHSMAFIGVKFQQLGPAVEYHGKRAPYYINAQMLQLSLPEGFKRLYQTIDRSFGKQVLQVRKGDPVPEMLASSQH